MEKPVIAAVREQHNTLIDAIANVHTEFAQMRNELSAAQREIARLRRKLSEHRRSQPMAPELDLSSLRRNVAFYCHPDRSGNVDLMRRLNVLFDYLESSQQCQASHR